jgi:hypothetical protein
MGDPVLATTTLDVTAVEQMYQPPPPRILAGAGQALAVSLLVVVTIVFLVLVAQVVRVRRACRPAVVTDGASLQRRVDLAPPAGGRDGRAQGEESAPRG